MANGLWKWLLGGDDIYEYQPAHNNVIIGHSHAQGVAYHRQVPWRLKQLYKSLLLDRHAIDFRVDKFPYPDRTVSTARNQVVIWRQTVMRLGNWSWNSQKSNLALMGLNVFSHVDICKCRHRHVDISINVHVRLILKNSVGWLNGLASRRKLL